MVNRGVVFFLGCVAIGVVIACVLLSPEQPWLESASQAVSIVAASAVVFGIFKYYEDKEAAQVLTVVEQMAFFREVVLEQYADALKQIMANMGQTYKPIMNRTDFIEKFDYAWAYPKFREKFKEQTKYSRNDQAAEAVTKTLNALEQFAWMIILNRNTDHPSLVVMRDVYCQIVENFAHQILFLRLDEERQFEGVKRIYEVWAPGCDRRSPDQKIEAAVGRAKEYKIV